MTLAEKLGGRRKLRVGVMHQKGYTPADWFLMPARDGYITFGSSDGPCPWKWEKFEEFDKAVKQLNRIIKNGESVLVLEGEMLPGLERPVRGDVVTWQYGARPRRGTFTSESHGTFGVHSKSELHIVRPALVIEVVREVPA